MNDAAQEKILFLLTQLSGLSHDIGKATRLFQEKLLNPDFPVKDPVRHEWISLLLLNELIDNKSDSLRDAFRQLPKTHEHAKIPFDKRNGIQTLCEALRFIVATHHGLFGPRLTVGDTYQRCKALPVDNSKHVRLVEGHPFNTEPALYLAQVANFAHEIELQIREKLGELNRAKDKLPNNDIKAIALITRASLILADHTVSSRITRHVDALLAANPLRDTLRNDRRLPNQDLNYHLAEVATLTEAMSTGIRRYVWPGLSPDVVSNITLQSGPERFQWQRIACKTLSNLRANIDGPVLVLNVAGTGSGKTRMNAKALAVLNRRPALRFSTALNLRTLTLQTGTAYRSELGIPPADLQCIIGDQLARTLHEHQQLQKGAEDIDGNTAESVFEGYHPSSEPPDWLKEYASMAEGQATIITPAVLVSTIDFLIAAGDPSRQGHHGAALMRLANSDLILDEIDDYDPEAFVAVLRMVEVAAMLGANIVASTATLPVPMAEALMRTFSNGAKAGRSLNTVICRGTHEQPAIALIDERQAPAIINYEKNSSSAQYQRFVSNSTSEKQGVTKCPRLVRLADLSEQAFFDTVLNSISQLHAAHCWKYSTTNKKISVGLIRVANIRTAVRLATFLSKALPNDRVATYHSRDFLIQRHRKEAILDDVLNRTEGNASLEKSAYIRALVNAAPTDSLKLIVVASPVEEVGRDHDFDWGVIEPSSMRSIIQSSGRINRHRLVRVKSPNIHILNFNYKACMNQKPAFAKPGYEPASGWPEYDLSKLAEWDEISEISAQLRFQPHKLCLFEDNAISAVIRDPIDKMLLEKKGKLTEWMSERFYRGFTLRSHDTNDTWRYNINTERFELLENGITGELFLDREELVHRAQTPDNTWLNWKIDENTKYAKEAGIATEKAFTFSNPRFGREPQRILFSECFGFCTE